MKIEHCHDIEELRPLAELWLLNHRADEYGLDVDMDVIIQDLKEWAKGEGAVLVAKEDNEIIGGIAVFAVPSYLGRQKIALEKYWFTKDGHSGPKLYIEALNWAKENGCSHLITSGSRLTDRHDSICRFLEKTGARHFETSHIYKL